MKTSYGYDSYRGRSGVRSFLTALVVILVLVLLAAVIGLFLLQDHIYYTADGKAHVDLPFFQGQDVPEASAPLPTGGQGLVVTPAPTATPAPTPAPTPSPALDLYQLPLSVLEDGLESYDLPRDGGEKAVCLDMKRGDGMLSYVSALPQAVNMATIDAGKGRNEALRAFNAAEGVYTVARVSCFRDNRVPRMNNALSIRSSAGNWLDSSGTRWISPAVERNADYVAQVCGELAGLGFDEVWLDYAAFPLEGNLDFITRGERYDPETMTAALDAFYGKVRDALADYPQVKVGLTVSREVLLGGEDASGQTLDQVKDWVDRIYTAGPEDRADNQRYHDGLEGLEQELVFLSAPYVPGPDAPLPLPGGRLVTLEAP